MPAIDQRNDRLVSRLDPLAAVLWTAGGLLLVSDVWVGRSLEAAFRSTIEPFLTLAAVIAIGWGAMRLGLFDRLAERLLRMTTSRTTIVVTLLSLTALLSGIVNLDVAVVVAMPLVLGMAPGIGVGRGVMALAVASIANATSILLPTSNLTTLLVRGSAAGSGAFLAGWWLAWLGVCVVAVAAWTWFALHRGPDASAATPPIAPIARSWSLGRIARDLGAMFVIAVGLRALFPAGVQLVGGFARIAATGSVFAAVGNNLPVAAVIRMAPSGIWPAILAMAIGPNLLLTGSVATVICRRLAREEGSDVSARSFTIAGLLLTPPLIAVAYIGLRITGAV
jgi:arsenical pump membrane protein